MFAIVALNARVEHVPEIASACADGRYVLQCFIGISDDPCTPTYDPISFTIDKKKTVSRNLEQTKMSRPSGAV